LPRDENGLACDENRLNSKYIMMMYDENVLTS